jgi:hypothetical protein
MLCIFFISAATFMLLLTNVLVFTLLLHYKVVRELLAAWISNVYKLTLLGNIVSVLIDDFYDPHHVQVRNVIRKVALLSEWFVAELTLERLNVVVNHQMILYIRLLLDALWAELALVEAAFNFWFRWALNFLDQDFLWHS